MTVSTATVQPLTSPWDKTFLELVATAQKDLLFLAPYMTRGPLELLRQTLDANGRRKTLALRLVTDLSPASLATRALDVEAVRDTVAHVSRASLTHLPSLHAKVYVADTSRAVITSGNLTDGGLSANYEFGILMTDPGLVADVRREAEAYAALGGQVLPVDLDELVVTARLLLSIQERAQRQLTRELRTALVRHSSLATLTLLRARARGKTTHGIFADSILYLLRDGPKRTVDLHRMVQRIHPDLCDDSIDRVIEGVHFGKRWKHYVRTAQQHLRRRGLAFHEGGRWYRAAGRHKPE